MTPTTNTEAGAVADVAAKLTEAQRWALLRFDHRVHSVRDLHTQTRRAMFKKGLLADLRAAGHQFFNWTVLGLAVRQRLEQVDTTRNTMTGQQDDLPSKP